jgi:hypothetical protein
MKKNKNKHSMKAFTPMSAVAGVVAMAAGAHAQSTPLFDYTFPASWNGTGTVVTDQSSAGTTGYKNGTVNLETSNLPSDAGVGTAAISLTSAASGGIKSPGNASTVTGDALDNSIVAADGGFTFSTEFLWNGTASATMKLIDYAGTESLQLVDPGSSTTSATIQTVFSDNSANPTVANTATIAANTWYNVSLVFDTTGNSQDLITGDISGIASLYVNGSLISSVAATKGTWGDTSGRSLAIGELGYGHNAHYTGFNGDIYNPSVDFGAVVPTPEPSSLALGLMGGLGSLGMIWNARRRKS